MAWSRLFIPGRRGRRSAQMFVASPIARRSFSPSGALKDSVETWVVEIGHAMPGRSREAELSMETEPHGLSVKGRTDLALLEKLFTGVDHT
jgi:hypothetical protein